MPQIQCKLLQHKIEFRTAAEIKNFFINENIFLWLDKRAIIIIAMYINVQKKINVQMISGN